jgi:hypothetical protein
MKVFFLRPERKKIYVPYILYSHVMQYPKCKVHENKTDKCMQTNRKRVRAAVNLLTLE